MQKLREIYRIRRFKLMMKGKISILEPDKIEKESILRFIFKAIELIGDFEEKIILDFGCGKKPYSKLFNVEWYIGLDLPSKNNNADVYADALLLPFKDNVFDLVICTQVLEHINEPEIALREIFRVLKPGGHLILTTPFIWGLHDEPHDYFRFTKHGLRYLLNKSGFRIIILEERGNLLESIGECISLKLYTFRGYPKSDLGELTKRFLGSIIQLSTILFSTFFGKKFRDWSMGYGVLAKK